MDAQRIRAVLRCVDFTAIVSPAIDNKRFLDRSGLEPLAFALRRFEFSLRARKKYG
jgi:hypothetical protein